MLQYKGPGEIVKSLSPNGTSYAIKCGTRTYRRNIMHMVQWKSQEEVSNKLLLYMDDTVSVGSYVAVLDKETDTYYHIAKVINIDENVTKLHYLATKSKELRSAIWMPLHHHPHSHKIVLAKPGAIHRTFARYTGVVTTCEREDSLIILPNIGFTNNMRINARTKDILRRMTQYEHHRITKTWQP